MDIFEIRRLNLKRIIERDFSGNASALARKIGKDSTYINRCLYVEGKKGKKNISDEILETIYESKVRHRGWMDVPHEAVEGDYIDSHAVREVLPSPERTAQPPGNDLVAVHFGSFKLEAGVSGYSIEYLDEELRPIFFREDWFRSHKLKPSKLIACRITGDSMEPRLYSGDSVVINTESSSPIDGEVFAINYEGELIIKRMHRDSGQWFLRSDNPDKNRYPDKLCSAEICIMIGQIVHRQSTVI